MDQKDFPLGVCKESVMYLESAMADISELCESGCFSDEQKLKLQECVDIIGTMEATICNIVTECGHGEEFITETISPLPIDDFPEMEQLDLLDMKLE